MNMDVKITNLNKPDCDDIAIYTPHLSSLVSALIFSPDIPTDHISRWHRYYQ